MSGFRVLLPLVLALAAVTVAATKPDPDPLPNTPIPRQGGDTIETAVVFEQLPIEITGTTTGYTDDYDEACPYTGSTSPDVVYVYHPGEFAVPCETVDIDLLGSTYDTKVYVYDSQLDLVACNDDFYYDYVSKIEDLALFSGETYAIVIDGYGGDHGDYVLNVVKYENCYVSCPPGAEREDEPPLQDGVPDTFNSGCDGDTATPAIVPLPVGGGMVDFCGLQGWIRIDDDVTPDIDWFSLVIGPGGTVSGFFANNVGGLLYVITPGGCDGLQIQQAIEVWPCYEHELTIVGDPGDVVWLRIATPDIEPGCGGATPQSWPYRLVLDGMADVVAVEGRSWSSVKGLFRVSR